MRALLVFLIALAAAGPAIAGFSIVGEKPAKPSISPRDSHSSDIGEIGIRPKAIYRVRASGTKVPLGVALKKIAPSYFHGYSRDANVSFQISWAKGENWLDILARAARESGDRIVVDWGRSMVTLMAGPKPVTPSHIVRGVPPTNIRSSALAAVISTTPKVVPVMAAMSPLVPTWIVKKNGLLSETLQGWSHRAGWSLVWSMPNGQDFRLNTGNSYSGDFTSAVKGLINSLPSSVHIQVQLRPDNTPPLVYVTNDEGNQQ